MVANEHGKPGVTVVVPTLNRGGYLYNCLKDLLNQDHYPLEILVVDQSSVVPDTIRRLVDINRNVISYHQVEFRGLPVARNYGWKAAKYDAIVYVDDDIRCPPNLVTEHLRALQLPKVGVVAGHILEENRYEEGTKRIGYFSSWTARIYRGFSKEGACDVDHAPGGNFSVWRHVLNEVGGFEEALNYGAALYEETEFCLRAKSVGYRVHYTSKAHIDHLASPTGGCRVDQVKMYVWALTHNRMLLIFRHTRWYQRPTAVAESLRLALAYAVHYRQIGVIPAALAGCIAGYVDTRKSNHRLSQIGL